jgi:repressor LexA
VREITKRQTAVLSFIKEFLGLNGYAPTIREIGEHFGITFNGARDHLTALIKKGFIKNQHRKARTMIVLKEGL